MDFNISKTFKNFNTYLAEESDKKDFPGRIFLRGLFNLTKFGNAY